MGKGKEARGVVEGIDCRTDWVLVLVRFMFVICAFVEFIRKHASVSIHMVDDLLRNRILHRFTQAQLIYHQMVIATLSIPVTSEISTLY